MTIAITASMRASLSALNDIANQLAAAQTRLATGKRVNNPTDDPAAFFTASALTARGHAQQPDGWNQLGAERDLGGQQRPHANPKPHQHGARGREPGAAVDRQPHRER